MDSKLTLKLDGDTINEAKKFARRHNISLSRMIENYLQAVTTTTKRKASISPLVKSLTGVIELNGKEDEKEYKDYLTQKYS